MPKACAIISKQEARMVSQETKRVANIAVANRQVTNIIKMVAAASDKPTDVSVGQMKDAVIGNIGAVQFALKCKCPFILHTIVYVLKDKKLNDIVNEMSDSDAKIAQCCISTAQSQSCPKYDTLYDMEQKTNDEVLRKALQISQVASLFWDDAVAELDKWSDAIDKRLADTKVAEMITDAPTPVAEASNVQQTPKKAPKSKKAKRNAKKRAKKQPKGAKGKELWPTAYLAEKLGISVTQLHGKKHRHIVKHPEDTETMARYFIGKGNSMFFLAEYFDDFAKMVGGVRKYTKRTTNAPATSPQVEPTPVATLPLSRPSEMTGVIALTKVLERLLAEYDAARQDVEKIQADYDTAWNNACKCRDPHQRAEILKQLQSVNETLLERMATADAKQKAYEAANALLRQESQDAATAQQDQAAQRTAAENLRKAEQVARASQEKLDATRAEIVQFLADIQRK